MKVFIANPTKILFKSTDHDYIFKCFSLMSNFQDIEFVFNNQMITSYLANFQFVFNKINSKLIKNKELLNSPLQELFFYTNPSNCDIIFSYGAYPYNLISSKRYPIVCEQTFAYGGIINKKKWVEYLKRSRKIYVERADILITPSLASLNIFKEVFPQYIDKVHYIPYFLPYLKEINSKELLAKYTNIDKINLLFVGKQAKRKGLDNFIEAYLKLEDKLKKKLEVSVISSFLDGKIELPKEFNHKIYVEDIREEFRKAHVLIFPTKQEAYGLVLVEAMAQGCNVLTTNNPIQKSILEDKGGWFVDPHSIDSIYLALIEILNFTETQLYFNGLRNLENFSQNKTPQKVSQEYFKIFSSLM